MQYYHLSCTCFGYLCCLCRCSFCLSFTFFSSKFVYISGFIDIMCDHFLTSLLTCVALLYFCCLQSRMKRGIRHLTSAINFLPFFILSFLPESFLKVSASRRALVFGFLFELAIKICLFAFWIVSSTAPLQIQFVKIEKPYNKHVLNFNRLQILQKQMCFIISLFK